MFLLIKEEFLNCKFFTFLQILNTHENSIGLEHQKSICGLTLELLDEAHPYRGRQPAFSQSATVNADVVVVQSPSRVRLFAAPWTAACQASLSRTISQRLLVMPSSCILTTTKT